MAVLDSPCILPTGSIIATAAAAAATTTTTTTSDRQAGRQAGSSQLVVHSSLFTVSGRPAVAGYVASCSSEHRTVKEGTRERDTHTHTERQREREREEYGYGIQTCPVSVGYSHCAH